MSKLHENWFLLKCMNITCNSGQRFHFLFSIKGVVSEKAGQSNNVAGSTALKNIVGVVS